MPDPNAVHSADYRDACLKHRLAVEAAARKRKQARAEIETTYRHALNLAAHAYRMDMEHADRVRELALADADANPPF